MAAQIDNDDGSEATFSDISEQNRSNRDNQNESDEFDGAFSEKEKRFELKPSQVQQNADDKVNPIAIDIDISDRASDSNDNGIAIQTEVLSDYLRPTNILAKYQLNHRLDGSNDPNESDDEEDFEEEEKEWNTNPQQIEFASVPNNDAEPEEEKSDFDPIGYDELLPLLMEQATRDIDEDEIIIEDFRNIGWFDYLKVYLFGGCAIALKTTQLNEERDTAFKMAKLTLDSMNETHNRMLQTLWMKLTDDTRQCDKTGSHWQQIGFQGNDPGSDVRGSGLFGMMQLIFMIENYNQIICKIYLLSLNQHQHFPLMIVSFTVSGIVIRLLRSCLIYNYINTNSLQSVVESANHIYVALFYQFYLRWKNKSRTIINFDEAHKELQQEAFSNWNGLVDQLKQRENEMISGNQYDPQKASLIADCSDDDDIEFGVSNAATHSSKLNSQRHNQYEM
eukprot:201637_1